VKNEQQLRKELSLVERDLKMWKERHEKAAKGSAGRQIIANTMLGLEGQIEALQWVLDDEE
jgi:hypothetical protein